MRRPLLSLFFVAYFGVWLAGGLGLHPRAVPEPLLFFTRSACLFPHAAEDAVDHYVDGFDCTTRRWVEVDPRPYFPIVVSGRYSRFDRAIRLFAGDGRVMHALARFVLDHYNADHPNSPIGDVHIVERVLPIPKPGDPIRRYAHPPLATLPRSELRGLVHSRGSAHVEDVCRELQGGGPTSSGPGDGGAE